MTVNNSNIRPQYICIDWENVQPEVFPSLQAEHIYMLVFVGAQQNKLSFPIVEAVQKMGSRARYVKVSQAGNNALDMHIAFYLGKIASEKPTAYFHIISKDTDYDPLIQHLKYMNIGAKRYADIMEIGWIKSSNISMPSKEAVNFLQLATQMATDWIKEKTNSRPASIETLKSSLLKSAFSNNLTEDDIESIFNELVVNGFVVVTNTKISYPKF